MNASDTDIALSIIAPAHNEQDNVDPFLTEIAEVIEPLGLTWEMVLIDDGSTDQTPTKLRQAIQRYAWLRVYRMRHTPPGRGVGPSGRLIASLDADLQNDPAEIPRMIDKLNAEHLDMIQGDRSANRRDGPVRRISSLTGRRCRAWLLGDDIRDTACALRLMTADLARQVPLDFRGMHRFIAFYARLTGHRVAQMPVNHRPRIAGSAKFGIWNRALPGLVDLLAVRWMRSRWRDTSCQAVDIGGR
jgi:glycosyltransferase involved in cell wall biosynthesis